MDRGFQVRFDEDVNALYFRLNHGKVARTVELAPTILVDVDEDGQPLGLEVLDAEQFLPFLRERGGRLDVPVQSS